MRSRPFPLALSLAAFGLHGPLPARAADEVTQDLPTVVVVGHTLLDETGVPATEMPANVQVIRAHSMAEQGVTNLADGLNNSLGSVSISNGTGNPYQNDVNYRGYQATSLLGAPVGLSVYFDGVRMNEPFGSNVNWDLIPMNAIDRLEVLPGSNPMFGLNTLGGALVVHTKNGKDAAGFTLGATGGSFHRKAGNLEAGWFDVRHATDYFLSANIDSQDGYRDHSGSRVDQLYGKARWHGDDDRSLLELSAGYAASSLSGTQALPLDMLANPRSAYTWPDRIANRSGFVSLRGSQQLTDVDLLTASLHARTIRAESANSNAELDDGCFNADGSLATTSAAGMTSFKCGNKAPDGTAVNAVTGANALALGYGRWTSSINSSVVESSTHTHILGAALQWTHKADVAGHRNSLSLGAQADRSNIDYAQNSYLARLTDHGSFIIPNLTYGFTADGAAPSPTNRPVFSGSNVLSTVDLSSTTRDVAVYLTDTFHVSDSLNFTLSGSFNQSMLEQSGVNAQFMNDDGGYSWTDTVSGVTYYNPAYVTAYRYSNSGTGSNANPNGVPAGAVAGPELHGLDGSHRYHRFNPALGFNYNLDPRIGLFGGYSEAMRAPTSIELSCADPNNPCALPTGFNGDPELQAVVAKTFEVGGRGRLGANLTWNAAVYRSRLGNDIQFIATSNSYGYFANVGDTERRGLELGLQGQWKKLSLSGNYGHVDATYRTSFVTAAGENVVSGKRIPGIPASTIKLRAVYSVTPTLQLGGTLIVADDQYLHGNESNGDPAGKVAGYGVLNLDLNYRYTPNLRFSVQLQNALDRRYSTYGLAGMTSIYTLASQAFLTPSAPRAVWIGVTFSSN